jgi:formamidopyrimidine-DNA glycosylase
MPELPEVETTKKDLSRLITSKKIIGAWTDLPKKISIKSCFQEKDIEKIIKGLKIEKIERVGKNIIFYLSKNRAILLHQKIAGHIMFGKWEKVSGAWVTKNKKLSEKVNSFIHFIVFLEGGDMVALSDPRQFFKVEIWKIQELKEDLKKIGPDALKISLQVFKKIIKKRKGEIKKLLINQEFVSGIGNIYSDEILWHSKINPLRKVNSFSEKEILSLYYSMKKILKKAVDVKGDSISDYRLITGEKGGYQKFHKVYQREGLDCKRKDGGIIKRKKFGNRYLRYCPICQT